MARKIERFEAHLDDYDIITVYIDHAYYQGQSKLFYLRDNLGTLTPLEIINVVTASGDYSKYTLSGFKELHIGENYEVLEEHAMATHLQYGWIVRTKRFDQEFYSHRTDFGAQIKDDKTSFVLWSPTASSVKVRLIVEDKAHIIDMTRDAQGVFSCVVNGNHHGALYEYIIEVNGSLRTSLDPYGYSSNANSRYSAVVDFNQMKIDMNDNSLPKFKSMVDASIVEVSVRDFSIDEYGNSSHPARYLGLIEENTKDELGKETGFDYLTGLGFSHVQLMPVMDFETVDELNPFVFYNWGYDPAQYFTLEGSFASLPDDPLNRIHEFLRVVSKFHEVGMRVNLDVVFNHVFDMEKSPFEKCVPGYYFRRDHEGTISNGSFCGNDFDSQKRMARKFIGDCISHYVTHYHIDGFRFDLMGIMDVETMNEIVLKVSSLRPDVMLYGEGWNMPTLMEDESKAMMYNAHVMPEIAFFNDFYRDHVKGASSSDRSWHRGYLTGDVHMIEAAKACLVGNTLDSQVVKLFNEPTQSINYVECHDNYTLWDKIKEACRDDLKVERIARQKAINAFLAFSQGVLLMQYGQESCRTKGGVDNSYRSSDTINKIDYRRHHQYQEVVEYTKDVLRLRKDLPIFRFRSSVEIASHVYFENLNENILCYGFKDISKYCEFNEVKVFFNPNKFAYEINLNEEYVCLLDPKGRQNYPLNVVDMAPLSVMVVAR